MQQSSTQETIIDHIKKDHQKMREQTKELEKRVQGRRMSEHPVFPTMKKEALGHMAAEEKLLYPPLKQKMPEQVADALKEHKEIREHFEHLTTSGDMPEEEWARHLKMLKETNEHHIQEEEREVLPAAQKMFDQQKLRELGAEFERMEKEYK